MADRNSLLSSKSSGRVTEPTKFFSFGDNSDSVLSLVKDSR